MFPSDNDKLYNQFDIYSGKLKHESVKDCIPLKFTLIWLN